MHPCHRVQLQTTDTNDMTASKSARAPQTLEQFEAVYQTKEADRQAHFRKRKSAQSTTNDSVWVHFATNRKTYLLHVSFVHCQWQLCKGCFHSLPRVTNIGMKYSVKGITGMPLLLITADIYSRQPDNYPRRLFVRLLHEQVKNHPIDGDTSRQISAHPKKTPELKK